MVNGRRGKTTSRLMRRGDTVNAGAFFPPPQLPVPHKAMGEHRRQHVRRPAPIGADCLGGQPQVRLAFLKTRCNGPPQPPAPPKRPSRGARRSVTERIRIRRVGAEGPVAHPPAGAPRQALLTTRHALAGTGVRERPWGPCGARAPRPTRCRQACGQARHGTRGGRGSPDHPLRARCTPLCGARLRRLGALEPAARLRRNRDDRWHPYARIHGVQQGRAVALQTVGHHRLQRQKALAGEAAEPRRCQRQFALAGEVLGPGALGPSGLLGCSKPGFREAHALSHQGIAVP
jgi:hypothetical protein